MEKITGKNRLEDAETLLKLILASIELLHLFNALLIRLCCCQPRIVFDDSESEKGHINRELRTYCI